MTNLLLVALSLISASGTEIDQLQVEGEVLQSKVKSKMEELSTIWFEPDSGSIQPISEVNNGADDIMVLSTGDSSRDSSPSQISRGGICLRGCSMWPLAESGFYEVPIHLGKFSESTERKIRWVLNYIESGSSIRFVPYTTQAAYAHIIDGTMCASYVGKVVRNGPQIVQLKDPECVRNLGTILHEISHLVGLDHEHQRPDRDKYIAVNYENIMPETIDQLEKDFKLDGGWITPYDYASIMHYGRTSFSRNSRPVIEPLNPDYTTMLDTRRALYSSCDWLGINKLYPRIGGVNSCIPHVAGRGLLPSSSCLENHDPQGCILGCILDSDTFLRYGYCVPMGGSNQMFPPPFMTEDLQADEDADPLGYKWAAINAIRLKKGGSTKSLNLLLIVILIVAINIGDTII